MPLAHTLSASTLSRPKRAKCALILGLFWGLLTGLQAQGDAAAHWSEAMRQGTLPIDSIEALYAADGPSPALRGKGAKPFQRWLAFMKPRVDAGGMRPSNAAIARSLERAEEDRLQESAQRTTTDPSWAFAGPVGPTGLGGSGRLNRLVNRPGSTEEWWACAPAGGLWRTLNGGDDWTAMGGQQLASIGVSDIAFHPVNPNRIWIATGDGDFGDTRSIGIWTSFDGGLTWEATGLDWGTNMGRTLTRILVHPSHPDTLWTSSSLGVYRSINGGENWIRTITGNFASLEVDPSDPEHILAAEFGNDIAESHDAGATWEVNSLDGTSFGISRITLAFAPSAPDTVYAVAGKNNDQGFAGFWRSTDGGSSWTARMLEGEGPNLLGWTVDGEDSGGQAWYDLALAVHPENPNRVHVGGVNLWGSEDGGAQWQCAAHWYAGADLPYLHADQHGLKYLDDGRMLVANDGGAFVFDPTSSLSTDKSAGLAITQAYRLDLDPQAIDRLLVGTQDNGTFMKHEGAWEHVLGGDGFQCAFHGALSEVVYASLYYGQVFRSDDGGNAFQQIAGNAGSEENQQGAWLTPWEVSPFNPDWVYIAKDKVYRSTNRGNHWVPLETLPGGDCTGMALAANDVSRLYVMKEFRMFRSTDGQTFSELDPPNGFDWITDVHVAPNDADHLWASLSNYNDSTKVIESLDGGLNWTNISEGLPPAPVNCVERDEESGILYAGTDIGVYARPDVPGATWERLSDGLPNVVVSDLLIHSPSGRLAAATYGRGGYMLDLPDPPAKDAALGRIRSPRGSSCADNPPVEVPVLNLGTTDIHQLHLQYGYFGGASADTVWNGHIAPGDSTHLFLDPIAAPSGFADFSIIITAVDGASDNRSSNNTRATQSLRIDSSTAVVLTFTSDCFGSQHGWLFKDAQGRVLHRSGWLDPLSTQQDTLCLPQGCMTFEVHRDQLSGYESLMADCGTGLAFSLKLLGTEDPFMSSPTNGVEGSYNFCLPNVDDGGCKDPYASNYAADALFDDGTCESTCYPLTIDIQPDCHPEETSWSLAPGGLSIAMGTIPASGQQWNLCLDAGCRTFQIQDHQVNGWTPCPGSSASVTLTSLGDTLYHAVNPDFGSILQTEVCLPPVHLVGCMVPSACNFDPLADGAGTCDYSCYGCTDSTACNFDPPATKSDGSCIQATGCTHPAACNFDLFSLCDDGSCVFPETGLDCDGQCLGGDSDGDGVCDGDEFSGCTHPDACNFLLGATEDDGSCLFPSTAWPDTDGDGFGDQTNGLSEDFCGVPPPGWVLNDNDCNDANANFYPEAPLLPLGGDVNCDGFVSGAELAPCSSDINQDGITAIDDLLGLLSEFGCLSDCTQDVDGNGMVSSADLLILLAAFGMECSN